MITVDFQLDEASLAEDLQHSPESANPAALEETCFLMPVRLCVGGVELFEQPSRTERNVFVGVSEQGVQQVRVPNEASCWLPLPLLGFATVSFQTLNGMEAGEERKLYLAGGGELVFTRQGEQLFVSSSINGKSASTHFAEALKAFRAFAEKVRQLLQSRIAAIEQHPSWQQWLS